MESSYVVRDAIAPAHHQRLSRSLHRVVAEQGLDRLDESTLAIGAGSVQDEQHLLTGVEADQVLESLDDFSASVQEAIAGDRPTVVEVEVPDKELDPPYYITPPRQETR